MMTLSTFVGKLKNIRAKLACHFMLSCIVDLNARQSLPNQVKNSLLFP